MPARTIPFGRFVSTGGYHDPHAVLAMDALGAACANLCLLAGRHGAKLLDGKVSLLPDQLADSDDLGDVRRAYLGCLPMAQTGYEEEARLFARATVLPGSESGGFGQNDVASPVFHAWSKQDRAGRCLDMALASLAPIALRALDVTRRPVPAQLAGLEAAVREGLPDPAQPAAPGQAAASIAEALRRGNLSRRDARTSGGGGMCRVSRRCRFFLTESPLRNGQAAFLFLLPLQRGEAR